MTIRALLIAVAIAAAGCGSAIGVTPAAKAAPIDATCDEMSSSCVYSNCTDAHNHGRYNIPQNDPAYCPSQDRDGDGYACEAKPN